MKAYADLGDLPEDDRIDAIGMFVAHADATATVGVIVDDDPTSAIAQRYVAKLTTRYKLRIVDVGPGPVAHSTLIRVAQRGDA